MTIDHVSSINITRVLQILYRNKLTSRPEISRELGMDRSTVSKIINMLAERHIVILEEKGESTSRGGRRPEYLRLNYELGHIVGIEQQTDHWVAVGINLRGEILFSLEGTIAEGEKNITQAMEEAGESVRAESDKLGSPLLGVVIALPGIINPYEGVIVRSNPLYITDPLPVAPILQKYFQVPILAENDANACCWGELFKRRYEAPENFLCILIELRKTKIGTLQHRGIGVGFGIVIDHHVHYGKDFSAGEFQSVFWHSPNTTQFSISDEDAQLITRDSVILEKTLRELSRNISLMVNTFNLTEAVIFGDISKYETKMRVILGYEIQDNWSHDTIADCTVRFSSYGKETVAFGSACMFLERLFIVPDYNRQSRAYLCGIDLLNTVFPPLE